MPEALIHKQFVSEDTKIDADERTVTAIISTGAIDRDGEILLPKGVQLEAYMKNPVVLWAHDYWSMPIGRAMWVKQGRGKITAKVQFAESQQAEEVFQLFKGGFLNAFSVGFRVLDSHSPTPDEIKKIPEWADARRIFDKWELLEFSAVPVPANPEALALAVKSKDVALCEQNLKAFGLDDEEEVTHTPAIYAGASLDVEPEETKTIDIEWDVQPAVISVSTAEIDVADCPMNVRPATNLSEMIRGVVARMKGKIT